MRIVIVIIATGLLLIAGAAAAQNYTVSLTGQEAGLCCTQASGGGSFTLNSDTHMLSFNIYVYFIYRETTAHIHCCAEAGTRAEIVFPLEPGLHKEGVVGPLTAQQEADLNAGLMYIDCHSLAYPDGEIRGQIYKTVAVDSKTWGAVKQLYQ